MNNSYEKLLQIPFAALTESDPTDELCQRVMHKIEHRELGRMRRQTFGFGIIVIAVIAAFIPAVNYLAGAFSSSGLGSYFSLAVSDGGQAMSNWKDLLLSITESLPVGGITIVVGLLIVALLALRRFMSYQSSLNTYQLRLLSPTA